MKIRFGRRAKEVSDFLVYLIVRLLICVVQAVSIETCVALSRRLARLVNDVIRKRGDVVDENLRLAFPQLSTEERRNLSRRMWEHLFLMVIEMVHAPRKIHDTNWQEYIHVRNIAETMRRFFVDRPNVTVSAHFGNFELAGFVFGLFGFEMFSVVRPLDNRFLDRWVRDFRASNFVRILPKNGSAGEISEMLARQGTLSVLADQHAGPKGCWVDFFGRPASTHKAIALFSLAHDAPLVVGSFRRAGGPMRFELAVEDVADPRSLRPEQQGVAGLTQWYTHCLERMIRRDPDQYWWVHRRWKDTRGARTKAA
ncbi:MAG TPA: lysophospholipid acyltransferase family protein [Pirellulales bacterium]|nr:lysophospholipid acyltransferase family protein [Pirellulales bacterium]